MEGEQGRKEREASMVSIDFPETSLVASRYESDVSFSFSHPTITPSLFLFLYFNNLIILTYYDRYWTLLKETI